MNFLLTSFTCLMLSFVFALVLKNSAQKRFVACGGVIIGSLIGLIPALYILGGASTFEITLGYFLPGMAITVGIDALSAFF